MLSIICFCVFDFGGKARAASAPAIITYQGKLLISNAAATTTQNMYFILYDAASGGNILYSAGGTSLSPSYISVTPTSGLFSVDIGGSSTNALDENIFKDNATVYLEVRVGSETLSPRKRITSVPYAFNAKYLDGVGTNTVSSSTYIPVSNSAGDFNFRTTTISSSTAYTANIGSLTVSSSLNLPIGSLTNIMLAGSISDDKLLQITTNDKVASSSLVDRNVIAFLNQDETVSGLWTFSATTTFATSTFTSSTISTANVSNLFVLNGVSLPDNSITDAMVANTITVSNYLPLAGGTMAGNIAMGGNSITGLTDLTVSGNYFVSDGSTTSTLTKNSLTIAKDSSNALGKFYIDASGNVSVSGTIFTNNYLADAKEIFSTSNGEWNWAIGTDYDDSGKFKISSSTDLGTEDRFTIDNSGQVGIGATSPTAMLHISKSDPMPSGYYDLLRLGVSGVPISETGARIILESSSSGVGRQAEIIGVSESGLSAGALIFRTHDNTMSADATERMRIDSVGNVGIGNSDPSVKLTISGGNLSVGSNSATSTLTGTTFSTGIADGYGAGKFYVDADGNVSASGTLGIFGDVIFYSDLAVTGTSTFTTTTAASSTITNLNGNLAYLTTVNSNSVVAESITLNGVTQTVWPSGSGGAGSWWATTTNSLIGYPNLDVGYAVVIGANTTSTNAKFEVVGNANIRSG
ncbi:MAG: hypothetical protein WC430_04080, partial [Patescibacteria group bacterium]